MTTHHQQTPQPIIWPDWVADEGSPFPLGVSMLNGGKALNFALYSKHAKRAELLLFREPDFESPSLVVDLDHLKNKTGSVWHCCVSLEQANEATHYAYRVDGPLHAEH